MTHWSFSWLVAAGLTLFASICLAAADPVRIPGTRTTLKPPPGFSLADRFPGLQRTDLQSSIMVSEVPLPAAEAVKGMTREGLARRGMTLISSSTEKVDGRDALLLQAAQSAAGSAFVKWLLVTGDRQSSVMIVGTFPKAVEAQVGAAIRQALLTASWQPGSSGDLFEGLTFRVTPSPRLKMAGRMANMVMLTESGRMRSPDPGEALYIVGTSVADGHVRDLRAFSEARAGQTAELKDIGNFEGRSSTLDGMAAYELLADAKDAKTGVPMRLYQVIAADGKGYVMVQGLVGAVKAAELLPEFRHVTASFRRASSGSASGPSR